MPRPLLLLLLLAAAEACRFVSVESGALPFLNGDYQLSSWFTAEGDERFSTNGRPVYVSVDSDAPRRYLYSIEVAEDHAGSGRWLIGGEVGLNNAWGFVESWATQPTLVSLVSDAAAWKVYTQQGWQQDVSLRVFCRDPEEDATVYVHAPKSPTLSGTYSLTDGTVDGRPLYVHARGALYLYSRLSENGRRTWIVSETPGDGAGLAFIQEAATADGEEGPPHPPVGAAQGWRVAEDGAWVDDEGMTVVTSEPGLSTWEVLRRVRLAPKLGEPPAHYQLSNGVPLPVIGFGAGATAREVSGQAVQEALVAGYQLIDGATAYDNEDLIGDLLASGAVPGVWREHVYLCSKLWFTELGFQQSLDAAARSLEHYRTDHHDLLLLHWPQCYPEVEWMQCDQVRNVGTWKESWRALERLYAEGQALAIGVSNFNTGLIHELVGFAATKPHIVQNHRDVLWQDGEAVATAAEHGIFYQAYSSLRGLMSSSQYERAREALAAIGARYGKSAAQVALRWEVQQGHGVVPRSHNPARLAENLDVLRFTLSEEDMAAIDALGMHRQAQHDEL